jgi:hypothetical protein
MTNVIKCSLLASLFFTIACKDSPSESPSTNTFIGTWLLKQKTGGIGGGTIYPGNDVYVLRITDEQAFVESRNDTITFSDRFITYVDATHRSQVIDFINSRRFSVIVSQASTDSLVLWDGFIDGYFSFYTRMR